MLKCAASGCVGSDLSPTWFQPVSSPIETNILMKTLTSIPEGLQRHILHMQVLPAHCWYLRFCTQPNWRCTLLSLLVFIVSPLTLRSLSRSWLLHSLTPSGDCGSAMTASAGIFHTEPCSQSAGLPPCGSHVIHEGLRRRVQRWLPQQTLCRP